MTGHIIIAQTQLVCQIVGHFSIDFTSMEGIGVTSKMVRVDSRPLDRSSLIISSNQRWRIG